MEDPFADRDNRGNYGSCSLELYVAISFRNIPDHRGRSTAVPAAGGKMGALRGGSLTERYGDSNRRNVLGANLSGAYPHFLRSQFSGFVLGLAVVADTAHLVRCSPYD
jgi:hypothetical protein